jgi:hypothetical protein
MSGCAAGDGLLVRMSDDVDHDAVGIADEEPAYLPRLVGAGWTIS